jgi:HlyD family secretion protein
MHIKLLFFAIIILFYSCKKKAEKTSPVVESITASVYASGIIKSKNQYKVFSAVNGLISEIPVAEGNVVKKGDVIIKLSNAAAQLNTENAKIAAEYNSLRSNSERLNELQVNINLAKEKMQEDALLMERQQNLWNENIGSRNELEQRQLLYKNSSSAYEAAKLRYAQLQKQISFQEKQSQKNVEISGTIKNDYYIKSTANGKVYSILMKKGEMVNTLSPVAIIGDADSFFLELQVDEYDIASIIIGQKIITKLDSYRGKVFEAKVTKINPIMNERSKSFTIEADFVSRPPELYPNLTTEANIIIETKEKVLLIPRSYLIDESYVIMENKEKRKVITGLNDYQKVEIVSGLNANDIIIKPSK